MDSDETYRSVEPGNRAEPVDSDISEAQPGDLVQADATREQTEQANEDAFVEPPAGDTEKAVGQDETLKSESTVEKEATVEGATGDWRQEMDSLGFGSEDEMLTGYKESRRAMTQAFQERSDLKRKVEELEQANNILHGYVRGDVETDDINGYLHQENKRLAEERMSAEKQEQFYKEQESIDRERIESAKELARLKYPDIYTPENEKIILNLAAHSTTGSVMEMIEDGINQVREIQENAWKDAARIAKERDRMKDAADMGSASAKTKETVTDYWSMTPAEFETKRNRVLHS